MEKVVVYKAVNGDLSEDKERAAASDLHHALPKSLTNPNSKVLGWSECRCVIENRAIIEAVFKSLDEE